MTQRSIFGGAMSIVLPSRFMDISQFRPVPDNQEVFADADTDQSFIIELLETPSRDEAPDELASVFHFNSIAHDNDATSTEMESENPVMESLGDENDIQKTISWGLQEVGKYRDSRAKANHVRVFVACFRLLRCNTDVIISFNSPTMINPLSSAAKDVDTPSMEMHNTDNASSDDFFAFSSSFVVNDYSIFG
eukprot:m.8412 g.8412  ORF g.8412 m.8412 type:complete len:192 (-) comp3113_c0_seq1:254-829(-)